MTGTSQSSGLLAAGTTTIFTGKGTLNFVETLTDGTNAATVTVYDNIAGSGTVLYKSVVAGASNQYHAQFPTHVRFDIGLTVVVSGTGSGAILHWGG